MDARYISKSSANFSNSVYCFVKYNDFKTNITETQSYINPSDPLCSFIIPLKERNVLINYFNNLSILEKNFFELQDKKKSLEVKHKLNTETKEKDDSYITNCMEKAKDTFIETFGSSDIPDIIKYRDFFKKLYSLSDNKSINIYLDYESVSVNIKYKKNMFNVEQYFDDDDDVVITCINKKNSAIGVCSYSNLQLYMDKY